MANASDTFDAPSRRKSSSFTTVTACGSSFRFTPTRSAVTVTGAKVNTSAPLAIYHGAKAKTAAKISLFIRNAPAFHF